MSSLESGTWNSPKWGRRKLPFDFDPATGKLVWSDVADDNDFLALPMDMDGAGVFEAPPEKDRIEIVPKSGESVKVETMHLSCKSDPYSPSHNYGGIVIYQYDGKSEWRTANNTHCKAGYVVIQDTDSEMVKKWKNEPGQVHGAIYRNAFGESVKKSVVGEGFAIIGDEIKINSGVFNNPSESDYHDDRKRMHELSEHCIKKIVKYWKKPRSFTVKEMLADYDPWQRN